jgi:hypothetical protein
VVLSQFKKTGFGNHCGRGVWLSKPPALLYLRLSQPAWLLKRPEEEVRLLTAAVFRRLSFGVGDSRAEPGSCVREPAVTSAPLLAWLACRDLKSDNLVLSRGHVVKLTDFGSARVESEQGAHMTAETGTFKFMAPEVSTTHPRTTTLLTALSSLWRKSIPPC